MKRIVLIMLLSGFLPSYTMEQQQPASPFNNLIMILDQFDLEKIHTDRFVMLSHIVNALEENCSPILVNPALWHTFLARRARYNNPALPLYVQHNQIHAQATAIARKYINMQDVGLKHIRLPRALYKEWKAIPVLDPALKYPLTTRETIDFDYICAKTRFVEEEWSCYALDEFAYVLIPKKYELERRAAFDQKQTALIQSATTPQGTIFGLTLKELALGLKVDHLRAVPDILTSPKEIKTTNHESYQGTLLIDNLQKIFVTRSDLGLLTRGNPTEYEAYRQKLSAHLKMVTKETNTLA